MRNRLSYYSLALLMGLALTSAAILVANPFGGSPASASPAGQASAPALQANATAPSISPFGSTHLGGDSDGGREHEGWSGLGDLGTNGTVTTTTSIYSRDE